MLKITKKLTSKPPNTFKFTAVNVYTVYELITKSKTTNSTGYDCVSMRIIKECQQFFARVICHLFNSMIHTKTFPSILKKSKIIPIKKPGSDPKILKSYRLISMLPSAEKIMEELMRNQLNKFLKMRN